MTPRLHSSPRDRRIFRGVDSLGRFNWNWAWVVLAVLLCLFGLARVEPETAEAVNTMIGIGAIGCVIWMIWQLMQHDQ